MDDGDRLLQAVLDDPDDDGVRLVLADWLDENGQPERAEFIRAQVELAGLPEPDRSCPDLDDYGRSEPRWKEGVCQCRGCKLRRREAELLNLPLSPQSAAFAWSQPLHRTGVLLGRPWPEQVVFRRGFVDAVTMPTQAFLDHAGALFAAQPVTRVTLADKEPLELDGQWTWLLWAHPDESAQPDGHLAHLEGLPWELFEPMKGDHPTAASFATRADALSALSDGCVAHGRAARLSRASGPLPAPSPRPARRRTRS
jgi:uncharacterized protein (TIGR02996 family)